MQQSLKQTAINCLVGLFIFLASSFNFLSANVSDSIPVVRTDTTITLLVSCDSLFLPETDSTYFTSTTVEIIESRTTLVDTMSNDTTFLDSLHIYHIDILHPTFDTIRTEICDNGQGLLFHDSVFTESTVYTHLFQSEMGCDSNVTLVLTVHPSYEIYDTLDVTRCENELPYIIGTDSIYTEGEHTILVKSSFGCDSLVMTVNLTINANPRDSIYKTLCSNLFPYEHDENNIFDAPGVYDIVNDDTLECHKITTLFLLALPSYNDTLRVSICDIDTPYVFGDTSFVASTIYTHFDTTMTGGCDSLTTLVLDIHPTTHDTTYIRQYVCRYDLPFVFRDSTLFESGEYEFQTKSQYGCDSTLIQFSFQVLENVFDTLNVTLCSNELPFVFDSLHLFDTAGHYTILHYVGNRQCPDVTTLNLYTRPSYSDTTVATICSTEAPFVFADSSFYESTVYTKHDTTTSGCDSLSTLVLTVNPAYPGTDTLLKTVCTIDLPYVYNGDTLTVPGTYNYHYFTTAGCDSTEVTLLFSIVETPYDTASIYVCSNEFPYFYFGHQIDTAGEYDVRIKDSIYCDTMRHLFVNVLPIYADSISVMICANSSYQVGDSIISEPGTYDIMLQTAAGCDSLVTVTLGHFPVYRDSLQHFTICENDLPFVYDGNEYREADTIVLHYQTVNGCDSIVSFVLNISPIIYNRDTLTQEICRSELPYTAYGRLLEEAGIYTYVTSSVVTGCDSVFYLRLIVHENPIPAITGADHLCEGSVTNLMVEPEQSGYLWSNGNTNQQITIEAAGTFTVTVTNEFGCSGKATRSVTVAALPDINISGTPAICYGDSSVLTVSGADHYVWDNGNRSTRISVHPTSTTVYSVTAYSAAQCSRQGSYTVVVNTLPTPVITGTTTVCEGDSTQFIAGGGLQYQWSTGQSSNRITVSEAGIYTLTVTDAKGCQNTTTQTLTVNARPTIRINGRTVFCQGSTTSISANGASSYEWSSGEQTSSINTSYAGTYTVTGTASNGCSSTASTTLTTSQIQATISGERHFCQGESTTLSVAGNEAYTYRWYDGSTTSSISVSSAGTYSVEVTNSLGCSNTISTTVSEYALPTPSISGNNTICAGRTTTLRASGGNRYQWDDGSTQAYISVNTTGTYEVTVTNQLGCSASTSTTVIVNPLPEINILTTTNICSGESVTISAHSPSALSYSWTTGQNTSMITVQPASSSIYTVLVVDENGCSNTSSTTINVNQRPDPYINGNLNICQGSSTTLTAFGGNMYRWSNGETTQGITVTTGGTYTVTVSSAASSACTATTQASVTVSPLPIATITENTDICQGQTATLEITATNCTYEWSNGGRSNTISVRNAGTYSVTTTNTVTGCARTLASTVTVNELPQVQINGTTTICPGESTTLMATGSGNCSYHWSNGTHNSINNVNTAGIYTVTATNTYQCSNTASVSVGFHPSSTPTISGQSSICPGESTTLTSSAAAEYVWSTGATTRSIIVTPTVSTTYSLTVTNAYGCQRDTSFTVSLSETPSFLITGTRNICAGETAQLTATGSYSYRWSNNSTNSTIDVTQTGTYTVTATNTQGCQSVQTTDVTAHPLPAVQINGNTSICAGQYATLTASSDGSCTYQWSNLTNNATTQVNTAGEYTVTATNSYQCSSTASTSVVVHQLPKPVISGTAIICPGQSATLTSNAAAEYEWSTGDDTRFIVVNPNISTTYTLTVTNDYGCQRDTSFTVTLSNLPVFLVTGTNNICAGQSAQLTATGNYSYHWSNDLTTQSINVTESGRYTVTATNAQGCTSTQAFDVTVNALPVVQISGNTTICQGDFATLTASSDGNCTFLWNNGTNNAINSVNTAGEYTVTATNAKQCTNTASVTVTVNPLPTPVITGTNNVCPGQSTTLTSSPSSTYLWSTEENTRSIIVTPEANTTYTLTVTDVNGCQQSTSFDITLGTNPSFIITGQHSICAGQSTLLTASGDYTYRWSTNATSQSINVSNTGTYTVTATNTQGCQSTETFNLTVNALPVIQINGTTTICQGNVAILTATSDNNCSYVWSNGTHNATTSVSQANSYTVTATDDNQCTNTASVTVTVNPLPTPVITGTANICPGQSATLTSNTANAYLWSTEENTRSIIVTPAANTTYTLTVTDANGCQQSTSYTVSLNEVPNFNISGTAAICAGQTSQLSASGNYTYRWSTNATNQTINVTNAGIYTVTATNTQGCQSTESFELTVNALPVIQINGTTTICQGDEALLTATSDNNCSYVWSNGIHNATTRVSQANTYTVTATDNNQCTNTATVTVNVNALPTPTITGNNIVCPGQSTTLTSSDATAYSWSTGETTRSIIVTPEANTTYTLTVTNANGCQQSTSYTVSLSEVPNFNISGTATICAGQTSQLSASGSYNYRWSNNSTNQTITVSEAGTYTATATNTTGCQTTQSFTLTVNALPNIQINGNTTICASDFTTLTATSSSECSYLWNNETDNSSISVNTAGTYTVTATDHNGCSNSASTRVTTFTLPTPNITGTFSICPGSSSQLTASNSSSYLWSTNDTTQSITVTPTLNSAYTVTVTDAHGCQGSKTINVQLFPAPSVNINGNTSLCLGETTTLTASSGFSFYRWSNESVSSAIEVNSTDIYSVTVTDQNGCQAVASKQVNVKPLPVINFMGTSQICQGNAANITALSNGNCSYLWSNGTTHSTATFTTAGTYTVTATQEGCSSSNSITISLYNNPVVNITGPSTVCPSTTAVLTASDALHYQWSNGDTTKSISVIPQQSGTYTVTVTDNHGCQGTRDFAVQLSQIPVFSINGLSSICAGETTQLTAIGDYNYRWSTNETSASINVNMPGLYKVTATNSNGCSSEQSIILSVNSLPIVQLSGNTSACFGAAAQVAADGGQNCTYLWDDGSANATRQFTESGLHTVTVTNAYGCTSTANAQITIHALPVPVISGVSTICSGAATTLSVSNATSYLWSNGETSQSINIAPTVNTAYNVTVTDAHGCQGNTGFAITISDQMSVNISGPSEYCIGETPTLSATAGYQYLWSTNDTSRSITINTPGTYKVTAYNTTGCSASDSIVVTVHDRPALNFGMQHSICEGESFTYNLPVDSNIVYTWSNYAVGHSITVTSAGIYSVTATNQYGCSRTASDSLYVRPLPVPSITGSSTICQGNNALLTAHGGVSYRWSNGSNTSDIAVFPNTTTTYAVTATNEFGCSAATSTIVNVNVLPSITFNGNHYFCEGNSTTINVLGGTTYIWSTGDYTSNLNISNAGTYKVTVTNTLGCQRSDSIVITSRANPAVTVNGNNPLCEGQSELLMATGATSYSWSTGENSSNIFVMPTTTTTYTVTGSDTYGCSTVVSKVVSVEALPDLHISGISTICNGDATTLTASGANTYSWNNGSSSNAISVEQGGTYTVTGTSANGCHNTQSITVTINPTPIANLNGANTICENSTIQLTATGGDAYIWNTGATTNAITINAGGNYSVTVTNTFGCSSSASINVSTLASPFLQIIGNNSTCNGSAVQLIASSNGNYYSWSTGANAQSITVSPTSSQHFKVTVANVLGCTATDSIYITVHPTYHDTIAGSVCQGQAYNQYGFNLPVQNEAGEFFHTQNLFTTFGCDSIVTLRLTVNPLPVIDTITGATLVSFTGSQIYAVPNPQYTNIFEWRISNTSWELTDNLNSVQVNFTGAGTGTLTAKAINECGFTEKSIFITCNVGVEEYANETNIRLYPNPVHSTLNIDLSETALNVDKVQLFDNLGRCVQTIPVNEAQLQLDCSSYASGVYYVKFTNKEYQLLETRKIIIK